MREDGTGIDAMAKRYVKLVLRAGRHDPDLVDAYYGPAGWQPAATQADGTGMTTQVFSRVAAGGDAGSTVTVGVGTVPSALTLQLLAYSGTAPTGPVATVRGGIGRCLFMRSR